SGGSPVTTGDVSFEIDGTPSGSPVTLSGAGTAQLSTSGLAVGNHVITATYNGVLGQYIGSTDTLTQVVDTGTTTVAGAFCNTGSITIQTLPPTPSQAVPYPSHIVVSGQTGSVGI